MMMAKGTPIFLQRAGSHMTSSRGSTLFAIKTSFAFFCSMRVVTCFRPNLRTGGGGLLAAVSPAAVAFAAASSRSTLELFVSGLYFSRRPMASAAWFLSRQTLNWLMAGGTFSLWSRIYSCKNASEGTISTQSLEKQYLLLPLQSYISRPSNKSTEVSSLGLIKQKGH